MKIVYSGISDIGLKRKINQDSMLLDVASTKDLYLFIVADGMGGHADGELASKAIVDGMKEWLTRFSPDKFENGFQSIILSISAQLEQINLDIFEKYNNNQVCGSTCVLLVIYQGIYGVITAGDSRIYQRRGFKIKSLMEDDVWENQESIRESMSPRELEIHPNYGKLINAIGTSREFAISVKTDELKVNDTFLLCSDGLYKYCPEKMLKKFLRKVQACNIEQTILQMKDLVYEQGAKDNISIIIVKAMKEKADG